MTDHFQRLGLSRSFDIDLQALERSYLERSRLVHPDYHVAGSAATLGASVELSAELNEAYQTLRDPFRRAEYLLSLLGGPTARDDRRLPPGFLDAMLEAREQIEQARGDPATADALEIRFARQYDDRMQRVAEAFRRAAAATDPAPILREVREHLNAAQYIRGLIRDLRSDG